MIIDINRYSTLTKLLYVTAYVLRFVGYIKSHVSKPAGPITVNELSKAQTLWIRSCQLSAFSKEINNLKNNPVSNRRSPLVRQLRLFLDSCNLLQCGGRIHNAPVGRHTKFPYLLPTGHRLTTLIVYATHANQLHGGVHSTVTASSCWEVTEEVCDLSSCCWKAIPNSRSPTTARSQSTGRSPLQCNRCRLHWSDVCEERRKFWKFWRVQGIYFRGVGRSS